MALIKVAPYAPDQPALMPGIAREALNVIPDADSYRPFPAFGQFSTALTARAQGGFYCRADDATSRTFAGDATKLYKLNATTANQFDDVSRTSGGAYNCAAEGFWRFAKFGSLVVAVNGSDNPQKFDVNSATNFSVLGGTTPPVAKYVAVVRDFLVMGYTSTYPTLVQWSAINNAEDWTASQTTMSDSQTLADGGDVTGLVGGEYGLVFQQNAIRRMTFVGPPLIFQFDVISRNLGAFVPGSIANFGDVTYFLNRQGFFRISSEGLEPIGAGVVDRTFWADCDPAYLPRITSAIDPTNKIYVISYAGTGNSGGTPNKMMVYHWPTKKWSRVEPGDLEMIYYGATQAAYTLDTLDNISTSVDALPYSLDSSLYSGVAVEKLAGFDTTHILGFFDGTNLAATVDTEEFQPADGRKFLTTSLRPMVDGATASITPGGRDLQSSSVTWGTAVAQDTNGRCPLRWHYRYQRARITTTAGDSWTHMLGVDELAGRATGKR